MRQTPEELENGLTNVCAPANAGRRTLNPTTHTGNTDFSESESIHIQHVGPTPLAATYAGFKSSDRRGEENYRIGLATATRGRGERARNFTVGNLLQNLDRRNFANVRHLALMRVPSGVWEVGYAQPF